MAQETTTGYIKGHKWSGIKEFLFDLAGQCNVTLTLMHVQRGWLFETVYYKADGEETQIKIFDQVFEEIIDEHNRKAEEAVPAKA